MLVLFHITFFHGIKSSWRTSLLNLWYTNHGMRGEFWYCTKLHIIWKALNSYFLGRIPLRRLFFHNGFAQTSRYDHLILSENCQSKPCTKTTIWAWILQIYKSILVLGCCLGISWHPILDYYTNPLYQLSGPPKLARGDKGGNTSASKRRICDDDGRPCRWPVVWFWGRFGRVPKKFWAVRFGMDDGIGVSVEF